MKKRENELVNIPENMGNGIECHLNISGWNSY